MSQLKKKKFPLNGKKINSGPTHDYFIAKWEKKEPTGSSSETFTFTGKT